MFITHRKMFITHKSYRPSVVFWKYFKYGNHSSETSFTTEQAKKFTIRMHASEHSKVKNRK
jgi:hypothetical protein